MDCLSPITIKKTQTKGNGYMTVPCGKCYPCLARKRTEWSFRLSQELKTAKSAYFVTMTYDDDSVPYTYMDCPPGETFDGDKAQELQSVYHALAPTLVKNHVQLFLKRLRHLNASQVVYTNGDDKRQIDRSKWPPIRYFLTGEYGDKTNRPHYHIILFNLKNVYDLEQAWSKDNKSIGFIKVGNVTPASIAYVTKYCITKHQFNKYYAEPPFNLMSKGIGKEYLEKATSYHKDTRNSFVTLPGGTKQSLPRYYRDKIFSPGQKEAFNKRTQEIRDRLKEAKADRITRLGNNYFAYDLENKKQVQTKIEKITKNSTL